MLRIPIYIIMPVAIIFNYSQAWAMDKDKDEEIRPKATARPIAATGDSKKDDKKEEVVGLQKQATAQAPPMHAPLPSKQDKPLGEKTPIEERGPVVVSHGTPQWVLSQDEIDYLFVNSRDLVCIAEVGKCFKRLNDMWEGSLGWLPAELMKEPYLNFVHPEDVEKTLKYQRESPSTGIINRYRCKDGSYRWLDWIILSRLRGENGQMKGDSLAVAKDITLQKTLEERIGGHFFEKKNKKWYSKQRISDSLIEMQSLYLTINSEDENRKHEIVFRETTKTLVNLSESVFGFFVEIISQGDQKVFTYKNWTVNRLATAGLQDFFNTDTQNVPQFAAFKSFIEAINTSLKPLIINAIEIPAQSSKETGTPPELRLKSFLGIPIIIKDKLIGIFGFVNRGVGYNEDLFQWLNPLFLFAGKVYDSVQMERFRHLEEEKKRQRDEEAMLLEKKKIESIAKMKSAFLAHMSHEVRTPLTGLLGMLDLVHKEKIPSEDREYIETAKNSGLYLLSIINNILDISKFESGIFVLEKIDFSPVIILQEVIQLLRMDADKKGITLDSTFSSRVPLHLIGDPTRLRQILFNLVGNAVKFTKKGSVRVSVDGTLDQAIFWLTGQVEDTGIGMNEETMKRLFQPFMQKDESMLRMYGGTGLGLFITKKLCEEMGGHIKVCSELGKGSTFQFKVAMGMLSARQSLPMASSASAPVSSSPFPHLPSSSLAAASKQIPPKLKVLVAEDNLVNQRLLKAILERQECAVTVVSDGKEAVEACSKAEAPYDVVLMDGEMPVMSGLEATKEIRKKFSKESLPIIGVTAHAQMEDKERFLKVGMNGYLAKPISQDALKMEILRCLSQSK